MNSKNKWQRNWLVLAVGVVSLTLTLGASAQVQTQTYIRPPGNRRRKSKSIAAQWS